ncbi:MAG TPA: asparagine synthase-related protein, partial [Pyrinomonadaceae bacterium]|nr:asparagine synthase-related protein [Pyrinomonadaceae bacterium]
ASIPANIKFKDGAMKQVLKNATESLVPRAIAGRKDKMGFPVPFVEWACGEARDFVRDILGSSKSLSRDLVNNRLVLEESEREPKFGRKLWGMLSLELWQQEFHDRESEFKRLAA